jgi:PKD repeat protein
VNGISGQTLRRRLKKAVVLATAGLVAGFGLAAYSVPAQADTAPDPGTLATVSADGLPTWQINGVVWSQVIVGNTVYATGDFTQARPPGTAVGDPSSVNRSYLLAYDITTGNLITSFDHALNAQGLALAASPDGSTVYVGGDFTTVDGQTRGHVAAFSTATGALLGALTPGVDGKVKALVATSTTLYAGGSFTTVGGQARGFGAAYDTTTRKLNDWNPNSNTTIWSMTATPDPSVIMLGGEFATLGGQSRLGLGAVDATTGAPTAWTSNQVIKDSGDGSAITSLTTDGTQVMGTGYAFGKGNYEGRFSIDNQGNINWLNDCHGDGYSSAVVGGILYTVGHAHNCSNIGQFPETTPRTWHRALAETTSPSCTVLTNSQTGGNYANFAGYPCTQQLDWYPNVALGSFTGQSQGAWSVAANSQYVVLGGEFPTVNGVAQQGLVRFAVSSIAPNKVGPKVTTTINPVVVSPRPGVARVIWGTGWDPDNETLTYNVFRVGSGTGGKPVYTTTAKSRFYNLPNLSWTETGLTPGQTYQYYVQVVDPFGNGTSSAKTSVTIANGTISPYANDVLNAGAASYWRLNQAAGVTTAADYIGSSDLTLGTGVTGGSAGAIIGDPDTASTFSGTTAGLGSTQTAAAAPNTFSIAAWFKTTVKSGKIVGYGNKATGSSTTYDRHIYLDSTGKLNFGVNNGAQTKITTAATGWNDGQWHFVVGTMSAAGMAFYVDGKLVGTNSAVTSGQSYNGYWRVGGDATWSGTAYFTGSIDDVAVYPTALTLTQIRQQLVDAGRPLTGGFAPSDAYGSAVWNDSPGIYYRLDETSGSTATDLSGNTANGTFYGSETLGTASAVTGPSGTGTTFSGTTNSTLSNNASGTAPSVYSQELWFKTTSTAGGELIGFGNRQSGSSTSVDRIVYMNNAGKITFQVSPLLTYTVASANGYNDGKWHQLVATQGSGGMALYLDGQSVATNTQTSAKSLTGYWRIGGDLGSSTYRWFNGSLDEVAIYPSVLTPAQVAAHYAASSVYNHAPTAAFTSSSSFLNLSVDGSTSSDSDGSIASYSWNWGDGTAAGSGATATHTYAAAGTYAVTLTVTDNGGATNTKTANVTVAANNPPAASFTSSSSFLNLSVNGSASSDSDGTIASYSWNWGDGTAAGSGPTATHTYAAAGTYPVTLTVTDDGGATNSQTTNVNVVANNPPTASFTSSLSGSAASVDASASNDIDGTIASYAWDFGDGGTASGVTAGHNYTSQGTFTVTLTVTDDQGATATKTGTVTINSAVLIASDAFNRSVVNGFGTADLGGAWTPATTATSFAVSGGSAKVTLKSAGSGPQIYLNGVSSSTTDTRVSVTTDKPGTGTNGIDLSLVGRRVGTADYNAKLRVLSTGAVRLGIYRTDSTGTQTAVVPEVVVAGLTYTPGQVLTVRFQVTGTGPTALKAKVWDATTTEPTAWLLSGSDATAALQAAGSVGVKPYIGSTATNAPILVTYTDFRTYDATTVN